MPFQQIQKYENGKNRVGASRLHLAATAVNVPVGEFFDGVPNTGTTLKATKSVALGPPFRRSFRENLRQNVALVASRSSGRHGAQLKPLQIADRGLAPAATMERMFYLAVEIDRLSELWTATSH